MLDISFSESEITSYLLRTKRWGIVDVMVEGSTIKIAHPLDIPFENFIVNKTITEILKWEIIEIFKEELKDKLLNSYYDRYITE
jgi:hypothetical protein